ncbi:DUF397 domain-containing protein [Streptomyces sp. NPDC048290]|uniref:DUF397 domain-containing protein n=1 Tax=Streptomyces sp. NPDC048290 TaxID=3155811 RepID=UPI00342D40B5
MESSNWRKSSYSGDTGGSCVECTPLGQLTWRKSSFSGDQGGDCVEVADTPCVTPIIAVRDSKAPDGPVLGFRPAVFSAFVGWASSAAVG